MAVLAALGWSARTPPALPAPVDAGKFDALYARPIAAPTGALRVFHLGHSLVGRDMPAMLAQLAGSDHAYESQLGWGVSLKDHWELGTGVRGFDAENAHPRYRAAAEAVDSGAYDAVVLTEMVEIKDAIRYHESSEYLRRWAQQAWSANPNARVYLYETWHNTDDSQGWLERIDADLAGHWEGHVLHPALAAATDEAAGRPIHVIPAGQVLGRFVRAVEAGGGIGSISDRADLFTDTIHLSDAGAYLVALTHYAVLYHRSPVGLPHRLLRADGTEAETPDAEAARAMQAIVWDVVTSYSRTGVEADDR